MQESAQTVKLFKLISKKKSFCFLLRQFPASDEKACKGHCDADSLCFGFYFGKGATLKQSCWRTEKATPIATCGTSGVLVQKKSVLSEERKKFMCLSTQFGCCKNGVTAKSDATGSNCDSLHDCNDYPNGCCADGVTPAPNANQVGCAPVSTNPRGVCSSTEFGCCPDGFSIKKTATGENCPVPGMCVACNGRILVDMISQSQLEVNKFRRWIEVGQSIF